MQIKDITIKNFRGIESLKLPLGRLTVLIGENNTGKSSILTVMYKVLSRGLVSRKSGQFEGYDFHLNDDTSTPQTAGDIAIVLHFAEDENDQWTDEVVQQLNKVIQLDLESGYNHIWFRVTVHYDQGAGDYITQCDFLNELGVALANVKTGLLHGELIGAIPVFLLSALRNANQEFSQRGQFWRGFLKSVKIPDAQRVSIEESLRTINDELIQNNTGLASVIDSLGQSNNLVALDANAPVVLEAVPTKVFDLTGRIQVGLRSSSGVKLPLERHGEGVQSLSVIMLFNAFVDTVLREMYGESASPLLLLEEPEAHLHPSAVRSLSKLLSSSNRQMVVSTHSGDLVARLPLDSIRRCYKANGTVKIGIIDKTEFDSQELKAIEYRIKEDRGRYLFARCWLLVEGETDFHVFKNLMDELGIGEDDINFSILEVSQAKGKGEPFMKLANMLGIEWFLVADGDSSGQDYISRANNHLRSGEVIADRAMTWSVKDIEHVFWQAGFCAIIESTLTANQIRQACQEANGNANTEVEKKIHFAQKNGKPTLALKLVEEIQKGHAAVPTEVMCVINKVKELCS
jgi:putative ATP-dependent endonuclease of OLD family